LKKNKQSFWFERSTKSDTCIGFPSNENTAQIHTSELHLLETLDKETAMLLALNHARLQ